METSISRNARSGHLLDPSHLVRSGEGDGLQPGASVRP